MKKCLLIVMLSLFSVQVFAFDWSMVRSGAQSDVTPEKSFTVFFYANAGETLTFSNFDGSENDVFCAISSFTDPTNLLVTGTGLLLNVTLPTSDLHLAICVDFDDIPSTIIGAVFEPGFLTTTRRKIGVTISSEKEVQMIEKVQQAIVEILQ